MVLFIKQKGISRVTYLIVSLTFQVCILCDLSFALQPSEIIVDEPSGSIHRPRSYAFIGNEMHKELVEQRRMSIRNHLLRKSTPSID